MFSGVDAGVRFLKFWRNILPLLLLVWLGAGGLIYWARHSKPTAQSVSEYLSRNPLAGKDAAQRAKIISHTEDMLNGLASEERRTLQEQGVTRDFFLELQPGEQAQFLDATLPAGFSQMMDTFNKMEPAKRKKFVDRALEEARKREGEAAPANIDDQLVQKVVNQGLRSFYSEASAETKLDLAPLLEQMQTNLQSMH